MFVKGLYRMYSLLLFTESKTQNSWDNFWLNTDRYKSFTVSTRTDPWSIGGIGILDNNQLANGPGIS